MDATVDAGHEVCVAEVAGVVEQRDVGLPVEASYMIIFTCIMYIYIYTLCGLYNTCAICVYIRFICSIRQYVPYKHTVIIQY